MAGRDEIQNIDPIEQPPPQSPKPSWATPGVPFGDDLLKSGARIEPMQESTAEPEEAVQPKLLPSPAIPSKQEIAEHQTTHLPRRNWCEDCNNGAIVATQHVQRSEYENRAVPVIAMDYAFIDKDDEDIV